LFLGLNHAYLIKGFTDESEVRGVEAASVALQG